MARRAAGRQLIDTGALVALASPRDQYHARAVRHARSHLAAGGRWIGTTLVLGELYGLLLYRAGPDRARGLLNDLLDDPAYQWFDTTVQVVRDAAERWLARYPDQRLTLTDAVSFEVMRREKLDRAFAYDHHFIMAGFEVVG